MKVLVIGGKGQLGTELCNQLENQKKEYVSVDYDQVDITKLEQVQSCVEAYQPTHIVNCAAFTKVDACETEVDTAYSVNAIRARNVAIAAERIHAKLIHISTDFIFDGEKNAPYYEFDQPNPLSVYGSTKLAGEEFVKSFSSRYFIIRTSWLYGHHGSNFVKTMLKLAKTKSELSVVHDQVGSPTYVNDLLEGIFLVLDTEKYGVYHYSNEGQCSWNQFAKKIFELAGLDICVCEISGNAYGAPAERPSYSVMEKYMFRQEFGYRAPEWEESLKLFLDRELIKEDV